MKLPRITADRALVAGFFPTHESALAAWRGVKGQGFRRSMVLRCADDGTITESVHGIATGTGGLLLGIVGLLLGITLGVLSFWWLAFLALGTAGIAFFVLRWLDFRVSAAAVERFKRLIGRSETVLLVETPPRRSGRVLALMREGRSEPPGVYVFQPERDFDAEPESRLLRHEPPHGGRFSRAAVRLAQSLTVGKTGRSACAALLSRLDESESILDWTDLSLSMSAEAHQAAALPAEWLLDNAYLIRAQIENIRRNLPLAFCAELPVVSGGSEAGVPRIYRVATEMVAEADAVIDAATIRDFIDGFQTVTPLNVGELWALPSMLRLRLVECLRMLAIRVEREQRQSEQADFWASRLIAVLRGAPDQLPRIAAELLREHPAPTPYFASELVAHLYDEETALPMVAGWLERTLGAPLQEVIQEEERRRAVEQTSLANAVTSCRRLMQIEWRGLVEAVSRLHAELREDPAEIYPYMDFDTRNAYRGAVEEIARGSGAEELGVAREAIALGRERSEEFERHIGYYLIDDGRAELERRLGCRVPFAERFRRGLRRHAAPVYIGGIAGLTLGFTLGVLALARMSGAGLGLLAVLGLLFAFPASELALQIVNRIIAGCLPPRALPKMSFEKEGLPKECRTLVVVPMLLTTPDAIRNEVERLEIRFLGNDDPQICFALLSDFADAPRQHMPEDAEYLEIVARGIEELNLRHGPGRFFLFHRERVWNESEKCWMGWERKRGKLEQLNRHLMGETAPELADFLAVGERARLRGVRYVITLDADTQLLRDSARRLVETISHPLNQPRYSGDGRSVTRGYTIIEPRVSTTLPSAIASRFSRIFSDPCGLDPYSHAVSDVYQDLTGEASYHGKGIYDLRAFHRVLSRRFPQSHLLSHDLIEGVHGRVGLASDIELLDVFPSSYLTWRWRQHRWIRGDWQIADWLLGRVPSGSGEKVPNPLSAISRWKIFDNLRRSLVPAATVALLALGWMAAPSPVLWSAAVAAVLLWPALQPLAAALARGEWPGRDFTNALARALIWTALLPDQALMALDAIARVAYRRTVSRQLLLEWETAHDAHRRRNGRRRKLFLLGMMWIPVASLLVLLWAVSPPGMAALAAAPFLVLWAFSPLLVPLIDLPVAPLHERALTAEDRRFLRHAARLTWRYFDDFVGPQTHWLPPDNYQETHKREVFMRTSPTNIGLWLLAGLTARDFGYLNVDEMLRRHMETLKTLEKLERFEGHFLNWYDIADCSALKPRYVSTVDSGNLLACLWTLEAGYRELLVEPVLGPSALRGVADSVSVLKRLPGAGSANFETALAQIDTLAACVPVDTEDVVYRLRSALRPAEELAAAAPADDDPRGYWARKIEAEVKGWNQVIDRYLKPLEILAAPPAQVLSIHGDAHLWRREALASPFSLAALAAGDIPRIALLLSYQTRVAELNLPAPVAEWLENLAQALRQAREHAAEAVARAREIVERLRSLSDAMRMRFLYDAQRRLFAIGYRVGERCLDTSFYDLLASESRLASLVSIARGDVPVEHWWALGRPFGAAYGRCPLLSWTGTMFEYLMPVLMTRICDNSLLGRACFDAVECQAAYGRERGVPWGISESAFGALDRHHIYQYRAFGVPALGLKRGLERDLVIAPYASALALLVAPVRAMENLRRLGRLENGALVGQYGFYEAMDYSRQRAPSGKPGIVVHCFMVHHQGMAFLSFGNVLRNGAMQRRFHADPRIRATEALLHEHIPQGVSPSVAEVREERPRPHAIPIAGIAAEPPHKPDTLAPRVLLLSNGNYSVMVTNAGSGYSHWRGLDLTRWRADTTRDAAGLACYFRDLDTGEIWSATHQPIPVPEPHYTWSFSPEKAEFRRTSSLCDTFLEIAVSAEDDAEVRRITLVNHSRQPRRIEVTSYVELALAPHNADRAHPAFNKLFIETEWMPEFQALIARRRPRSPEDRPVWVAHLMCAAAGPEEVAQYETDRAEFLGRGRTTENPQALERDELSRKTGDVLDPILSLRRRVTLGRNQRAQLSLVVLAAESREALLASVQRYAEFRAIGRVFDTAWTHAQLEMRRLHIHAGDAQLFQHLAAHVLYPQSQFRPPHARLGRGVDGQAALWGQGISGDLPIVTVTIADRGDLELVRQVLTAHTFWYLRGLRVDLLIVGEEAEGYEEPLLDNLRRLAESYTQITGVDIPGGVYIRSARKMPEMASILAASRAVLIAARGTLRQQLAIPAPVDPLPPRFRAVEGLREEPSTPLPFLELESFNGLGGFTGDGREYAVYLGSRMQTPLPWVNVMANPGFGTIVSESGSGFTWYGNSQSARLTPWSNDPVSDPADSALYIRDEEMGVYWTPTPLPIRELDAYRCRHGQGYTVFEHNSHAIEQELTVFVPVDARGGDPVRLQRLRLRNTSSRRRRLSVTCYCGLVLGTDREETQLHIATKWDLKSASLFARNVYHPDFREKVAFMTSDPEPASFSGDRGSFIGRNRSLRNPMALERVRLSGIARAGLDPCMAVQTNVELEPGQQTEITFMLGLAGGRAQAQALVEHYRDPAHVERALRETCRWWDDFLGTLEVRLPAPSANWLVNRWLPYQALSCRIWARSAFYQSGGAFGFRDQLQDSMALMVAAPWLSRQQILRSAARQFVEGDVQHWWHPQSGGGVRTRMSDDLLWLPYVTAHYVRTTGDAAILRENIPFLEAKLLEESEVESFAVPKVSAESGTLLEHCRRAIRRAGGLGEHGIPLIGTGDWNDGMNRVGEKGRGESVWLGWFLVCVLNDFAGLLEHEGEPDEARAFRAQASKIVRSIEENAWDGEWYLRAFDDEGHALGSGADAEARIDSLSQSWAAISGMASRERVAEALLSVDEQLVWDDEKMILLFTPPFRERNVGYIQAYPPGVRENGGQYTHAAVWVALAFACRGDGTRAAELLQMLNPAEHTADAAAVGRYQAEPYALAADVYALKGRIGRAGWTWYTGAAGWLYRVWIEAVLGFRLLGGRRLQIDPVLPKRWPEARLRYRYRTACYEIVIENPAGKGRGVTRVELDGAEVPSKVIELSGDGRTHAVRVIL